MNKFKNPYLLGLKNFAIQLVLIFATLMFMGTFTFFISTNTGRKLYSTITGGLFCAIYYSNVWNFGRSNAKFVRFFNKHNENKISVPFSAPVIIAIVSSLPNIIALIFLIYSYFTKTNFEITNSIYRIFQCYFIGWLGDDNLTYIPNCIIVTIIPILLTFPAYISGVKEFSITEKYLPKLIYKQKKNK